VIAVGVSYLAGKLRHCRSSPGAVAAFLGDRCNGHIVVAGDVAAGDVETFFFTERMRVMFDRSVWGSGWEFVDWYLGVAEV
jgi:hypothetical protein